MAGASKGIGAVTAEVLASAGAAVVLAARDAVAVAPARCGALPDHHRCTGRESR